jgi:hypothetical protein
MSTPTNTLLIAFHDDTDLSTPPTASFTPVSGFPLTALDNADLLDRTRTTTLTSVSLTRDLGAALPVNVVGVIGTNMTLAALRRVQFANDSTFTDSLVESGTDLTAAFDASLGSSQVAINVPRVGLIGLYVHPVELTRRYVRWHQSDITNPEGFQEWAMFRVGLALQFHCGFQEWRALPTIEGPLGSQVRLRGHEITYMHLTKDEAYALEDLAAHKLNTGRMLVVPEALATETYVRDALWATFEGAHVREPVSGTSYSEKRYKVTLTFREATE